MNFSFVLRVKNLSIPVRSSYRHISNKDALFTKPHRLVYARLYPTVVVNSDGSSITVRHPEPRKIIRLPLDLTTLSDAERKERLEKRKPKKKIVIQEDIQDNFNAKKYVKFIKKKN